MAVNGRLDCFALGDVLQVLGLRRVSGVVRVSGDRTQGDIHLEAGVPVRACTYDGNEGENAFFALLRNSSGEFAFHSRIDQGPGETEPPATEDSVENDAAKLTRGLDSLLLQAAEMHTSPSPSGSSKALCYDDSGL